MQPTKQQPHYSEQDLAFMHSLSSAVLENSPRRTGPVLMFWMVSVFLAIVWSSFAKIDEIARGQGKIVTSGDNQMIQNLEGGIIEQVMVAQGDMVRAGQVLLKIDNQKSQSVLTGNAIKAMELQAKIIRLQAQATASEFLPGNNIDNKLAPLVAREKRLYLTSQGQLKSQRDVLQQQLSQRRNELESAKLQRKGLSLSLSLIREEVTMTEPVVLKGVKPKVEFLKLQREANAIAQNYDAVMSSIPRLQSAVLEAQSKLQGLELQTQGKAQQELNEVSAELDRIMASNIALTDQVSRTLVRAPTNGIIQALYVNTVGGVVKPGADLIELVPSDDVLWVEAKLKPADIAFIYPGQKAIIKFTAYDFAIYGGLEGEVVKISADTLTDRQQNTFYTVHLKTQKGFLGSAQKPLKILPGMVTSVDIITGKKSVLDYILKPILRAKYYTFSER